MQKKVPRPHENVVRFILFVFLCSLLLVVINYYTIKTISGIRAYIHGEAQYTRGEKDAVRSLIMYVNTSDNLYWKEFQNAIRAPMGDSIALHELTHGGSEVVARQGFLNGNNHADDLNDIIWFFNTFKNSPVMKNNIRIWKDADVLIGEKVKLAEMARIHIANKTMNDHIREDLIKNVNTNTRLLTALAKEFSDTLGEQARTINRYLFYFNIAVTLSIVGSATTYASHTIKRLNDQNQVLKNTNSELDKFVYSASHDLRAPITSLKGLIEITQIQDDFEIRQQYFSLMKESLDKQDEFIRGIIDFARNKRKEIAHQPVSLAKLTEQCISQHRNMPKASEIQITTDFGLDNIVSDPLQIQIILNNLISNAFKYYDAGKAIKTIAIKTSLKNRDAIIEVSDNGIGIKKENISNIFDMFFITHNSNGTGLGLYIARETATKLNGTLNVESELLVGSKFILQIPLIV